MGRKRVLKEKEWMSVSIGIERKRKSIQCSNPIALHCKQHHLFSSSTFTKKEEALYTIVAARPNILEKYIMYFQVWQIKIIIIRMTYAIFHYRFVSKIWNTHKSSDLPIFHVCLQSMLSMYSVQYTVPYI